jgi:hypothetical protein
MVRLSVNINKIATIRNARGGKVPDVLLAAVRCRNMVLRALLCTPVPMSATSAIRMSLISDLCYNGVQHRRLPLS